MEAPADEAMAKEIPPEIPPEIEATSEVESGNNMEWEVETVPAEEPEEVTVTEETVVEEYFEPDYQQSYNTGRKVRRRWNKHLFTWVGSFFLGIYGVDRFMRGQIALGVLKLLTFGGFGFWYIADAAIAIINSYAGPYRYSDDVTFDEYGRYTY